MATTANPYNVPLTPEMLWDVDYYKDQDLYFYLEEIQEILPHGHVKVKDRGEMIMLGSYSYLGLLGHPRINRAAIDAIEEYGSGTHGVRLLAGTLSIHNELEDRIASFKETDGAITFSSGYVANLATISGLLRKGDTVICDKFDHASIVDGCMLSQATFRRFRHNDMEHLERRLEEADPESRCLVIVDAVFSMDGDIINLPEVSRLCRKHGAYLMVDEAHSIGVLGDTGHGIEEHFGLPADAVDIKMGTLSKTIPSAGGYVAGNAELIKFLKHEARGFVFSAALPPSSAAAALATLDIIEEEPERVQQLQRNYGQFSRALEDVGIDLLESETAILPVMCYDVTKAAQLAKFCQERGIFVQAVVAPVVPQGLARLRVCVSAVHRTSDLDYCVNVLTEGAQKIGGILDVV